MSEVMEEVGTTLVRWTAHVFYKTEYGLVDVRHDMEELEELQDLVERGPHWDCIDRIDIRRAIPREELMTVEQARNE